MKSGAAWGGQTWSMSKLVSTSRASPSGSLTEKTARRSGPCTASTLAATEMPAAPAPTMTTSWRASSTSSGVRPVFAMRRATPYRRYPEAFVRARMSVVGRSPACDRAQSVADRVPERQCAKTGLGSASSVCPNVTASSSETGLATGWCRASIPCDFAAASISAKLGWSGLSPSARFDRMAR
jgi:hypothetical protein